jgi:long-chain acyl-CoA synthetase
MAVTDAFLARVVERPDGVAVAMGDRRVTYGELLETARRVGRRLGSPGSRQRRVGLLLGNRIEFLEIFLGTVMAGGLVMVFDPKWSLPQLEAVLKEAAPDIVFVDEQIAEAGLPSVGRHRFVVLAPAGEVLQDGYRAWLAGEPQDDGSDTAAQAHFFLVGYTSGTSGRPKGFIRDHRSWQASLAASRMEFGTGPSERILVPGPLVHGLGLYAAVEGLSSGSEVHLLERFDARHAIDRMRDHRLTMLIVVPTMLAAILDEAARGGDRLADVATIVCSGSKLSPALRERLEPVFPEATSMEYYGASELSFVSLLSSREGGPPESVGRAFHGVSICVRDEQGRELPLGTIGEIFVNSELISAGYIGKGDGTGFRRVDGWASVGDRGWLDRDGFLHVVGREGDMLITDGLNLYPAEVEEVLKAAPEIAEAVVFGLSDPYAGDLVCAVLCWRGNARLPLDALRRLCRSRLDSYKTPRRFFAAEMLPQTTSGKVMREKVRELVLKADGGMVEIV